MFYGLFYRALPLQAILGFPTCTTKRYRNWQSRSTLESSQRHLQSTTITTEQEGQKASTAFVYRIHKPHGHARGELNPPFPQALTLATCSAPPSREE